jgi:hypothetical protein
MRSASWAPVERVVLYQDGEVVADLDVPVSQETDFATTVSLVVQRDGWIVGEASGSRSMFPAVAAQEFEPLSADAVIEAIGSSLDLSGLAPTGPLRPSRTLRLTPAAVTNPIWLDKDGDGWTPPEEPIARVRAAAGQAPVAPDVRERFAAIAGGAR